LAQALNAQSTNNAPAILEAHTIASAPQGGIRSRQWVELSLMTIRVAWLRSTVTGMRIG
jgi:hypothetical protein